MSQSVISEGILLVAVVVAAATISQVFLANVVGLQSGSVSMAERLASKMETDICILGAVNQSETVVKVWLKNTGSETIPSALVKEGDVLFGEYGGFSFLEYSEAGSGWRFTVLDGVDSDWHPGETLEVTVTSSTTLTRGDYYFAYITHNGIKDEIHFSLG